jgi:ASC-1-like (ASCH) protein
LSQEGGTMKSHTIFVKKFLLPHIENGKKDLEVRVKNSMTCIVEVGDTLFFNRQVRMRVTAIREYRTFEEMSENESTERICPGVAKETLMTGLRSFYPPRAEAAGVIVFELKKE